MGSTFIWIIINNKDNTQGLKALTESGVVKRERFLKVFLSQLLHSKDVLSFCSFALLSIQIVDGH